MSMIQQWGEELTNEIRQELRAIKMNQEMEIQGRKEVQGESENKMRTCPKVLYVREYKRVIAKLKKNIE